MKWIQDYIAALHKVGILSIMTPEGTGEKLLLQTILPQIRVPIVFDVGANIGKFTKDAVDANGFAHIYAFEPHPVTFKQLATDDCNPQIQYFNIGLGNTEDTLSFYDYKDNDGSSHASLFKDVIETIHGKPSIQHQIKIRRLDDVANELGLSHIDFLKIDTEGNELDVLHGAEGLIKSGSIDVIQFEFNEMNVISRTFFKDFWDYLAADYNLYRLCSDTLLHYANYSPAICEIFAYQNIICIKKGCNYIRHLNHQT